MEHLLVAILLVTTIPLVQKKVLYFAIFLLIQAFRETQLEIFTYYC